MAIRLAEIDLFGGPERPLEPLAEAEDRFSAVRAAKSRTKKQVREKDVEADHMARVKADGGHSYKFVSPARRSVPDRLDLLPIPPEHRDIVARYVRFTECKKPGEKPTPSQLREHEFLRSLGFTVDVVDQRTKK